MKIYLSVIVFCLLLSACGRQGGTTSGHAQKGESDDVIHVCQSAKEAMKLINRNLTKFEEGVFYAYYCR